MSPISAGWGEPGLNVAPQVPAITAAAAIAGWISKPIIAGISTTPTAAVMPAALVIAVDSASVTSIAAGMTTARSDSSGPTARRTRC
jgi:hypothetical protein